MEEAIYALSHDLRGPLLNLQGFLRRLKRGYDTLAQQAGEWNLTLGQREALQALVRDRIEPSFQILEQNSRRMESLVQALLDLSRAGREPVVWGKVRAGDVFQEVAADLHPAILLSRATLDVHPLPELWSDRARLARIFYEILSNAVKFLSPSRPGRIRVAGSANAAEDICLIEDNGIGLRPHDLDRVFLPFGRVREIEAPGCGVGLATVRKLMGQLGGHVWIESVHQEGSTVYLAFPHLPEG